MRTTNKLPALLVTLIFALVGTYLLVGSHADSPYASTTTDQGSLSGSASQQPDSTATDGQKVQFGLSIPMDGEVSLGLSSPGDPFSPTSFWNTQVPSNVTLNPNSADYVNEITNQLCFGTFATTAPSGTCTKGNVAALNSTNWSGPLYVVPADQPLVPVESDGCSNQPSIESLVVDRTGYPAGVPVPSDAHGSGETNTPDTDTDQEITIYQPSSNQEWEFWHFQKNSSDGNWEACVGGVITNVSGSAGIFPSGTGSTASGLPLLGGLVRIDEMQAGQIDHVMNLSLEYNLISGVPANIPGATHPYSWPANRNDGGSTNTLAIPEGQRFILDPSLDLSTLGLTPYGMAIAVAAQKYGFVVDDSASDVNIRVGDPTTYTNIPSPNLPSPYSHGPGVGGSGTTGLFAGSSSVMKNFPWEDLEALPYNYGEPS
jgi:hypothetical protein